MNRRLIILSSHRSRSAPKAKSQWNPLLGGLMIDKKVGEVAEAETPGGKIKFKIIKWIAIFNKKIASVNEAIFFISTNYFSLSRPDRQFKGDAFKITICWQRATAIFQVHNSCSNWRVAVSVKPVTAVNDHHSPFVPAGHGWRGHWMHILTSTLL